MKPADVNCAWVRDAAPEFVLGTLDGQRRAELIEHAAGCATCRADIAGLSASVNDLALLAAPMTPSATFEAGVLAAITAVRSNDPVAQSSADLSWGVDAHLGGAPSHTSSTAAFAGERTDGTFPSIDDPVTGTGGDSGAVVASIDEARDARTLRAAAAGGRNTRWTRARWMWTVSAAAVVVFALVVAGVRILGHSSPAGPVAAPMISTDGQRIGESTIVHGSPDVVTVIVSYPFPGTDYALEGVGDGGSVVHIGTMHLRDGVWRWSGKLKADAAGVHVLRIVTPTGFVVCQGSLPQ